MLSEAKLLKTLSRLGDLFEYSSKEAKTDERMEAFESAHQKCKTIMVYVERHDISSAVNAWKALEYFVNDSIGGRESFLEKYQPIKQSIINLGLR